MRKYFFTLILFLSCKLWAQSTCNEYCIYTNKEIDTINIELKCFDITDCTSERNKYHIYASENSKYIYLMFKIDNFNADSIDFASIITGSSIVVPLTPDFKKEKTSDFLPKISIGTYVLHDMLLDKFNKDETQISKSASVTIKYKKVGSDEVKGYTIPIVVEYTKRL